MKTTQVTIEADDMKNGMTVAEIGRAMDAALDDAGQSAQPIVETTWRGRIKRIRYQVVS